MTSTPIRRAAVAGILGAIACAALLFTTGTSPGLALETHALVDPAAALSARYAKLKDEFARSQFLRPIRLDSSETNDSVGGEIFAVLSSPFATVSGALDKPAHWCDILILHLNNKYCRASAQTRGTVLHVVVGSKGEQALKDAYQVDFDYRLTTKTADYLQVNLDADKGPLSTRNYRIVLEATPTDDGRTFVHLSYAYSFGVVGRVAMQAYLNTVARDKVGFTIVADSKQSEPRPVSGMRGAVERNTMRYYLAIEAFLGALSAPAGTRIEKSFRDWFTATEAYSRQLHEIEQGDYLAMKRKEYSRQQVEMN